MQSRSLVLVIDDDAMIRRAVGRMIHGTCEVAFASTAEEALGMIEGGAAFDAILCDLHLGDGLDGRELYERLLARSPEHASRMILTSGSGPQEDHEALGRALAGRWLRKPFVVHDLMGLLDAVMGRCRLAG